MEENFVMLLEIKMGMAYLYLQWEIWQDPLKANEASYLYMYVRGSNEIDMQNGH